MIQPQVFSLRLFCLRRDSHILRELLRATVKLQASNLQAPEKIQTSSSKIERGMGALLCKKAKKNSFLTPINSN